MYVATLELEGDEDLLTLSAPDGQFGQEGVELDQSPTGIWSTAFTTRSVSGAFQIGGRPAGEEIPVRSVVMGLNLFDIEGQQTIEETMSRFRKLWGAPGGNLKTVKLRNTTEISGLRWLNLRLAKEIEFTPVRDPNLDYFVRAVVNAVAYQPMWESEEVSVSWSNPSAGEHTGSVVVSNPTDQKCFLEWSIDPADEVQFPDFSFGIDSLGRTAEDADRMIITPELTQRLSVMADPMMDTYISEDLSNAAGLFNGVEPLYWLPPYTPETEVPVVIDGPAGATITCTMRRLWSAEAGIE